MSADETFRGKLYTRISFPQIPLITTFLITVHTVVYSDNIHFNLWKMITYSLFLKLHALPKHGGFS